MMRDIGMCRIFTLCKMDEVHLILKYTFFETHKVDVRRKPVRV